MKWHIIIPVWGESYRNTFVTKCLPSLLNALRDRKATFTIYTDAPEFFHPYLSAYSVLFHYVPAESEYRSFGLAHTAAVKAALPGEWLMLTCADIIYSREVFDACEARFKDGKSAIVAQCMRTILESDIPTDPSAAELLDWSIAHQHPITQNLWWGSGRARIPSVVYFREGDGVSGHGFHLHPLAIVAKDGLDCSNTIDEDLLDNFSRHEIHVVTSPDELAVAELSPAHKRFKEDSKITMVASHIASLMSGRTTQTHRWLFGHKITLRHPGANTEWYVRDVMNELALR